MPRSSIAAGSPFLGSTHVRPSAQYRAIAEKYRREDEARSPLVESAQVDEIGDPFRRPTKLQALAVAHEYDQLAAMTTDPAMLDMYRTRARLARKAAERATTHDEREEDERLERSAERYFADSDNDPACFGGDE